MQKSKTTALLFALLVTATTAYASDFSAVAPTGQTLYYTIVTGGVQVVYPAGSTPTMGWMGYTKPTGVLTIPATVTYGGTAYNVVAVDKFAFYECTGLTTVTVPEGVTAVRASAFRGCSALDSVSLPSTLDSLGTIALGYCPALSALRLGSTVPPTCASSTFSNDSLAAVTLYVPCGCTAAYLAVAPWSQFGSVSDIGCNVTLTVGANYADRGTVSGGGTYPTGTNAVLTATPAANYFFACWNDGDTLNPRIVTASANRTYTAMFFALRTDTVQVVDTVILDAGTDTVFVTLHDTIYQTDSVFPTFVRLTVESADPWRGLVAGNAVVPAGTLIEMAAVPLEGSAFSQWSDGSTENPRRVQVNHDMTFVASFAATAGIAAPDPYWTATVDGAVLTVGAKAGDMLDIYDMQGHRLLSMVAATETTAIRLPAAGVYLLSINGGAARKIVINNP